MLGDYPVNVVLLATDLDAVKDVRAEVADLRRRGVKIEDYDLPSIKTIDGIADIGFAWMAWFIDPAKNCVGIIQVK